MALTTVATDISWSQNAAQYLAMLGDLAAIQAQVDQIQPPALRYSSKLLDRVPPASAVVASIPNLSQTLAQATQIFDDRAAQSASFAEWWNGTRAQAIRQAMDHVRAVSDYLGDEIVLAAPLNGPPIVLAEVRRDGLDAYLTQMGITGPRAFEGNLVVLGATAVPAAGQFPASPLGAQLLASYQNGAGLLLAANMEQIVAQRVPATNVPDPAVIAGVDNLRFVVAESKTSLAVPANTASFTFSSARHGLASWLAAPGPMGSLEYRFAPGEFRHGICDSRSAPATFRADRRRGTAGHRRAETHFSNVPASVLSTTWPDRWAAKRPSPSMVRCCRFRAGRSPSRSTTPRAWNRRSNRRWPRSSASQMRPQSGVTLVNETVNGRTFYTLTLAKVTIQYVFVDGYLLLAPNRGLLTSAIDGRASGQTLPRSDSFRAQLPLDTHTDFSAVAYYNLGSAVGPIVDQLNASGLLTPEQQKQISALTANRAPTLVYAYGSPDQILVGSRNSIAGYGFGCALRLGIGLRHRSPGADAVARSAIEHNSRAWIPLSNWPV